MNITINIVKYTKKVQEFQEYDLGQITTTLQDLLDNSSITIDSNIIPILKILSIDNIIKNYLIKDLTENIYNTEDYITGQDLTENDLISFISESQIIELQNKLEDALIIQQSTFMGTAEPTDTPTGTGNRYWVAVTPDTYLNHGSKVVAANSLAIISVTAAGVWSVSQTALNFSGKVNVSDVVNNLTSTETEKPGSANNDKLLNEKILVNTDALTKKADLVVGKNIYDYTNGETISGFYLNTSGNPSPNAIYKHTGYIPITVGKAYCCNRFDYGGGSYYSFYDVNKVFIISSNTEGTVAPANAVYLRFSLWNATDLATVQIEEGIIKTAFEVYKKSVNPTQLTQYTKTSDLTSVIIPLVSNKADLVEGKNKFNKATAILNYYMSNSGYSTTSTNYDYSDYIPVTVGTQYTSNLGMRFVAYYNDQNVIVAGGYSANTFTFTPPVGVAFVIITVTHTYINNFMLVSETILPGIYLPYKKAVGNDNLELLSSNLIMDQPLGVDTFKLFLPKEVCVAIGRTIELYNNQVSWCGNINDYHFLWSGVGKSMKRKWSCTGVNIGTNVLTLKVYNKNNVLIATKTTSVRVVSATIVTPFTIAGIGDSLSNGKPWGTEIKSLSANNISFVGTRQLGTGEGRSGATSAYYLGNNSYTFETFGIAGNDGRTQDLNPFWNPATSDVDFSYYKSNYNQNPTKLLIWLGTNGIAVDPTTNATNIKIFIDKIRLTGGTTIPIFVVHTLFRGNQDGIGKQTGVDGYVVNSTYKLEEDLKVFNLQEKMLADLSAYPNLYLIPVSTCHDSEFNFGAVSTPVNPRASQVEFLPTEATHPQTQGYLQIADIIFSSLAANQ